MKKRKEKKPSEDMVKILYALSGMKKKPKKSSIAK